jgi:hypothetical protein
MRCGRKQWFRTRNRDDGEIADGLSHPVAVSRYGQQAGRADDAHRVRVSASRLQAAVEYWHHRRIGCHFSNSRLMNMRRMLPMVGQIKTLLIDPRGPG